METLAVAEARVATVQPQHSLVSLLLAVEAAVVPEVRVVLAVPVAVAVVARERAALEVPDKAMPEVRLTET